MGAPPHWIRSPVDDRTHLVKPQLYIYIYRSFTLTSPLDSFGFDFDFLSLYFFSFLDCSEDGPGPFSSFFASDDAGAASGLSKGAGEDASAVAFFVPDLEGVSSIGVVTGDIRCGVPRGVSLAPVASLRGRPPPWYPPRPLPFPLPRPWKPPRPP